MNGIKATICSVVFVNENVPILTNHSADDVADWLVLTKRNRVFVLFSS